MNVKTIIKSIPLIIMIVMILICFSGCKNDNNSNNYETEVSTLEEFYLYEDVSTEYKMNIKSDISLIKSSEAKKIITDYKLDQHSYVEGKDSVKKNVIVYNVVYV